MTIERKSGFLLTQCLFVGRLVYQHVSETAFRFLCQIFINIIAHFHSSWWPNTYSIEVEPLTEEVAFAFQNAQLPSITQRVSSSPTAIIPSVSLRICMPTPHTQLVSFMAALKFWTFYLRFSGLSSYFCYLPFPFLCAMNRLVFCFSFQIWSFCPIFPLQSYQFP